jgi:hypothetical protein
VSPTKFSTAFGAAAGKSSRVISPRVVERRILGLDMIEDLDFRTWNLDFWILLLYLKEYTEENTQKQEVRGKKFISK